MSEKWLRRVLPRTLWGDRIFTLHRFNKRLGRLPENPPARFNDRLFALKTSGAGYDPLVQFVTDKEYAKLYVSSVLGADYVVETYRVLRGRDELKDYRPDRFPCIMKPTHSSGQALICIDAAAFDRDRVDTWFGIDYYKRSREQNYRYLTPKIIVEEFFSADGQTAPDDYKIFCIGGVPKFVQVDSDRFTGHTRNLYDTSWNRIFASYVHPQRAEDDPKPEMLDGMLDAARKLAAQFPFVRVDFFVTPTEIRVGELTFFPESAAGKIEPPEIEFTLGAYFGEEGGS